MTPFAARSMSGAGLRWAAALGAVSATLAFASCSSNSPGPLGGDQGNSGSDTGSGSSGSGSGAGTGTASGSGGGAGSGSGASSGTSSGLDSGSAPDAKSGGDGGAPLGYTILDAAPDGPTTVTCGSGTCNLSTHTCCLSQDLQGDPTGTCIKHGTACTGIAAAFNCGGAVDCPANQVCCGEADNSGPIGSAKTVCAATCPTMSPSSEQGQAQVCRASAECQNGMPCIPQTCLGKANLNLCGLTTADPFDCQPQ